MSGAVIEDVGAWPTLEPVDGGTLPDIPADTLPPAAARMVREVAAETETPEALGLVTALGCMSIAAAGKAVVIPREGWRESVNVYTMALSVPGTTKSPVLRKLSAPLVDWEAQAREMEKPRIADIAADRATQEQAIAAMRKKAAGYRANGEIDAYNQAREEIVQAERNLPEVPPMPLLFVTDATPEALKANLFDHPTLGVLSDEGGIFDVVGGLYTGGKSNIDVLLQGWDGGSQRVARGKELRMVDALLTICLLAQPAVLRSALTTKSFTGRGLLERFLIARPANRIGFRALETAPTTPAAHSGWADLLHGMLDLPGDDEQVLHLSREARAVWMEARREIEVQLRPDGALQHCAGWAGKAAGEILRLAGLFHLAERAPGAISDINVDRAVRLMAHFARHAADAFAVTEQPVGDAIDMVAILRPHAGKRLTRTDISNLLKGREMGTSKRIQAALEELEDRGYVRQSEEPTAGRSRMIVQIREGI